MSINTLPENLDNILGQLDSIADLNRGGCLFSAIGLVEWLKRENSTLDPEIVFLIDDYASMDVAYCIENSIPTTCYHAVVKVDEVYVDSIGIKEHNTLRIGTHTLEEVVVEPDYALKCAQEAESWNPCFNRNTGVTEINYILGTNIEL